MTDTFTKLAVDRWGDSPHSNMTTRSLEQLVDGKTIYRFETGKGVLPQVIQFKDSTFREFHSTHNIPKGLKHATLEAVWDPATGLKDDSNILGGNGKFLANTQETSIEIPVVSATEEYLSYYRAHLLRDGDSFQFQTHRKFPIFTMEIGENYVPGYIMKSKKGFYLEYHNEPHYHEPINIAARGSYLLAKEVGWAEAPASGAKPRKIYHLTAFTIPYGTAVYSEPGAIHDDATTIGDWRVGYIDATRFSTVTVLNLKEELLNLSITTIKMPVF